MGYTRERGGLQNLSVKDREKKKELKFVFVC